MYSPDDLDGLLSDSTEPPHDGIADPVLLEKVLARTTGVLRIRRRMKRLSVAAALAGCYLAGMLTMSLLHAPASDSAKGLAAHVEPMPKTGNGESMPLRPLVRPEDDGVVPSSSSQHAELVKLSPYDRLRRAGDRQLEDENDIAAAARTYRRALKLASPTERDIVPDKDTWLLMAMKNDQTNKLASEDIQ